MQILRRLLGTAVCKTAEELVSVMLEVQGSNNASKGTDK